LVVPAFALLPADDGLPATLVLFSVGLRLLDFAFFEDFFDVLLGAFLAVAVFCAVFLVFFVPRLLFFARFFIANALTARARGDLRAFFAPRFLTVFFLGVATTISFYCSDKIVGDDH
jgi:hypothetical protein